MKITALALSAAVFLLACENHEPIVPQSDVDGGTVIVEDSLSDTADPDTPLGCVPGLANCDNVCFDLQSDPAHCGTCDGVCHEDELCAEGVCQCDPAQTRCGLSCVDIAADAQNCGSCGTICGAIELCQAGECVVQCDEGLTGCGGACIDTTTDQNNCGGCGILCLAGDNEAAECMAGGCEVECERDWYDLDGADGCEYFCGSAAPGTEVCDGEDNDCDGAIDADDSDYEVVLCPLQFGVCAGSLSACGGGALVECDDLLYAETAAERPYDLDFETWCDGLDNNCSGLADESCCGLADLPVRVPEAVLPIEWDDFADFEVMPFLDAPIPIAVVASVGRLGDSTRSILSLAFFDGAGGHGRLVQVANSDLGSSEPVRVLEALWNTRAVLYTRTGDDGPLVRREYNEDGTEIAAVELAGLEELGTIVHSIRGRVLDDGTELLLVRISGTGTRAYAVEVQGGLVTRDVELTSSDTGIRLVDILRTGSETVACVERPALAPDPLRCFSIDADFVVGSDRGFPAFRPSNGRARFARFGSGWVIYLTDSSRAAAVRVEVDESATITATATAIRVVEGNILTGSLPTGEPAALIAEEHFDVDPPVYETTLIKPESGGAVVASYAAPGAVPHGFIYGDEATFVTVMSLGEVDGETFGRAYAFRLSQDGAALCLDAE